MGSEEEKRRHRCCFSGHRPEKLKEEPEHVKRWLEERIDEAIAAGYTTFISGCGMGVDLWAGQIVIRKKQKHPELRLMAATPWPGFSSRWSVEWREQYHQLIQGADLTVTVSKQYHDDVFQQRNQWMVDHSSRLIAYFNGAPGGTRDTIDYAEEKQIEVITNQPDYEMNEKIASAEAMRKALRTQMKRYPLMAEEDIVKFVFQGMLGVGHLIRDEEATRSYLRQEMDAVEASEEEPLTEKISPEWVRLNLRTAKARGIPEGDILRALCRSAETKPLSFTRQNVYNFCVKLDGSEKMKAAAEKILDANWLPSHSERYRAAYHPAYRVLHRDWKKMMNGR